MARHEQTRELVDAVIVGGGMVGLALGVAFSGAGVRTVVFDRDDPNRMRDAAFDGRVCAISYGSMRVLEGIGAWSGMAEHAQPILEIRVVDGESPLFLHYDHREIGDAPLGWIVENRVIRKALHDVATRATHLAYLAPADVDSLTCSRDVVEVALADGRSFEARLAVGADGRRSRIREAKDIRTIEWSYPQTGIVCTVAHEQPHRGVAGRAVFAGGTLCDLAHDGQPLFPRLDRARGFGSCHPRAR